MHNWVNIEDENNNNNKNLKNSQSLKNEGIEYKCSNNNVTLIKKVLLVIMKNIILELYLTFCLISAT